MTPGPDRRPSAAGATGGLEPGGDRRQSTTSSLAVGGGETGKWQMETNLPPLNTSIASSPIEKSDSTLKWKTEQA
jgi:hypothetical protein